MYTSSFATGMGGLRRNRRVGFALMFFVSFGQGFGLQQPATFTATRARKVPPRRRPKGGMGPLPRTTTINRRWPRLENDKLGFFSIHSVPRTLPPRQTAISYGLHESEGNGTYNGRILDGSQSFDVKTKFHERCDGLDVELALDLAKVRNVPINCVHTVSRVRVPQRVSQRQLKLQVLAAAVVIR